MARQKLVHDSDMVAHLWANQSQAEARNQRRNFYFEGATIYSYGGHFPIAMHVTHKKRRCVLFTTREYSPTTSKHKWIVRGAMRGLGLPVFHVQHPTRLDHKDNLKAYATEIISYAQKAKRARSNAGWLTREAQATIEEANAYSKFFGLRKQFAMPGDLDLAEIAAKEKRARELETKRAAARRAEHERQEREFLVKAEAAIERWRSLADTDEDKPVLDRLKYFGTGKTFLRVHGSRLESSRGAIVPLDEAIRLLPLIRSGREWQANGVQQAVGQFWLRSVDAQGNVQIGCHYIERQEIDRIAQQLGV